MRLTFHSPRLRRLALCLAAFTLAACDRPTTLSGGPPVKGSPPPITTSASSNASVAKPANATPTADDYDIAKMDFKPGPAKVSTERHTGAFAAGDALTTDLGGPVKPLVQGQVKEVRLDTTHKIIDLAPGVKFTAWTFGNQVPGPVVRVRVGDRVKFSMTNRSDEHAPGLEVSPPMMHSMDFHAAMVSPQDKYRSVAPGQTITFEFTPNYPGVYMYHCGTPMVLEHIASGMYGMVIVEPRNGYPTKVDREYAVVQSEFYTRLDPQHRKIDNVPLYVLDTERVRTKAPTYTVFNGRYNGLVDHPFAAKPGERVRLFVVNVGPSNTSSFHVVGTIFDRVWLEGNPDNQLRGAQTVLLGSSNSAIVELVIPEAGSYVMVDHHFANASQGAIGLIAAGEPPPGSGESEHHNIPATGVPTDPAAVNGKLAFESKCLACHSIGGGDKLGPDLYNVTKRRNDSWLTRWLRSPEQMLASDADAKALLDKYTVPMPNQNLSDKDIREFIGYFKWADENLEPRGEQQPAPAATGTTLPPGRTLSGSPGEVRPGGEPDAQSMQKGKR
ncbi:MAG TPA: multicopper oxidase domain-containing protein [Casimicrobiaceae bacterium]|nr:multicopper oxidase domain-containing protein [Casimicrobiaceae bacterium]